jgi:hypothetical protein
MDLKESTGEIVEQVGYWLQLNQAIEEIERHVDY